MNGNYEALGLPLRPGRGQFEQVAMKLAVDLTFLTIATYN